MSEAAFAPTDSGSPTAVASLLRRIHPLGWVAAGVMLLALVFHVVIDTGYLIGNFSWWHWAFLLGVLALSIFLDVLHRLRLAIESVATVGKNAAWMLAWVVFLVQLFNVITRYANPLTDRDILIGQATSVAWQSFGLLFLLGIGFGMRDGVNPRIDFWWANFSHKAKAWLDFVLHVVLLFPFVWMAARVLRGYAAISLGQKRDGSWPEGWRVWHTWEESPDADQLPVGGIKAMIFVAFILLGIQVFAEMVKTGFVMMGRDEYGHVEEAEAPLRIE